MLSRRGAPRDSPSSSPRSESTAREEPSSRFDILRDDLKSTSRDANDGNRFAAEKEKEDAAAAARSSETAYDDLVGTSSDSLLDMAVRRVVLDLDARAGNCSEDADGVDDAVLETPPPRPTLGTHERIASLPPDLAQVVFDAVIATKRLGAGGVPLARQFKYLWVVDLAACGDVAEDDVVETLLAANARTLLRLSVARCVLLSPASLHGLERRHAFPALTHLDLSECATVTDETLACVARAPNLITLKAEGCAVVGGGLRHVAKLEKLKHLSLERCGRLGGERSSFDGGTLPVVSGPETVPATHVSANVSDLADAALRAAKKRRTGETKEGDEDALSCEKQVVGVPALAALTSLETLNLGWCNRISDDDIAALGELKALKKLVLARTRAGAKAAEAIRRLSDLEALDVTGAPFDDEALAILTAPKPRNPEDVSQSLERVEETSPLPRLRELSLEATPITGRAGDLVAGAFTSSLVALNAAFTEMSDDGVGALERARCLRFVNLDSCPVSDAAAKALSRLPELESVTLADTDVGNDGVDALASRLTRLAHLDLGHTLVDDDGVERLRFFKNTLRSLSLDSRLVSDRGVKRIAELHELESLDLFAADVTDACAEALRHMTKLKSLEACGGRLSDAFVARVALYCPNLETLHLGQNAGVTDAGAECVAASLTKLTALNLCGSKVTDAGAKKFARLRHLSTLALKECRGVTSASARFLRENCSRLTEVTFGDAHAEPRVENENVVANDHPGPGPGPGPVAITAPIVVEDELDVASVLAAEAAEAAEDAEDASEMEDDFQTESSESESDADPPAGDA